jgi:hypothetical protein
MGLLANLRRHQIRASRLVATLAAVAWFGFAVAPCQASPLHESMPAGDCGHCPTAPSDLDNGCATVAAPDCPTEGLALVERRDTEIPQPPAGPPPAFTSFDAAIPDGGSLRDTRARRLFVSHVSIQQRYCTYLK